MGIETYFKNSDLIILKITNKNDESLYVWEKGNQYCHSLNKIAFEFDTYKYLINYENFNFAATSSDSDWGGYPDYCKSMPS